MCIVYRTFVFILIRSIRRFYLPYEKRDAVLFRDVNKGRRHTLWPKKYFFNFFNFMASCNQQSLNFLLIEAESSSLLTMHHCTRVSANSFRFTSSQPVAP
jgi:hypothetical protein